MTVHHIPHATRLLLGATLLLGAVAAQAAAGYTVTAVQEASVTPGMTAAQVRQALGQPARDVHYRSEPGATWSYDLAGSGAMLDVDFGANGHVLAVGERPLSDGDF
jgi:hypothetical protein